jgi:DNA-binding LytR/AlgR family response regulator
VDDARLQFALRELRGFLVSWRYWATIVVVVLVFTVTGPFGTGQSMPLLQRLSFWMLLHVMAFSIAVVLATVVDVLLEAQIPSRLARMLLGSALAAPPIGFCITLLEAGFVGSPVTMDEIIEQTSISLPLCLLLCLLTYLTSSNAAPARAHPVVAPEGSASTEPPAPSEPAATTPPLVERLNPQNRGRLLRLSVQDHYTEVVTSRGRELILLRFSDALNETGKVSGRRIHRSHWVADEHVRSVSRVRGKLFIEAADGTLLPVSRPYEADIRARFGGTRPPVAADQSC